MEPSPEEPSPERRDHRLKSESNAENANHKLSEPLSEIQKDPLNQETLSPQTDSTETTDSKMPTDLPLPKADREDSLSTQSPNPYELLQNEVGPITDRGAPDC